MRTKLLVSAAVLLLSVGTASASCMHQGVSYPVGSVLCMPGGWLEECTVASYWKAIGTCNAADPVPGPTATVSPTEPRDPATDRSTAMSLPVEPRG